MKYDFRTIEEKWQRFWEDQGLLRTDDGDPRPKFYCLVMYPYPSGVLHMGHVINYTLGDVLVRYKKMRGFNVLSPMGWDSFGLPAENAAIKMGIHPAVSTKKHIDKMRSQMKRAGWVYDWSREIATSHPGYYKWNQWLFLKFYEKGLAFKKMAPVNWCPSCATVLANEQVIAGECERCGTQVEQKNLEQWFFKMSAYAQRLLDNHAKLGDWPSRVLKMQAEWIGRSEGAQIHFTVAETGDPLPIFTTRPDTVWGVTFMSLAPEHPLVEKLVKGTPQEQRVMTAVREMRRQGTAEREQVTVEKVGVPTGFHVVNPVNGEKVPLWVANFALMSYGTGAVMSVPAHDQRDFEFARQYGLPVKVVIQNPGRDLDAAAMKEAFVDDGVQVNSGPFDGLPNREAIPKIIRHLDEKGIGRGTVNYRLRDWLLSRQRYWGAPIPIVYCDSCGEVPVPEKELPVLLPDNVEFRTTGENPLARCKEFVNTACPKCGKAARRETDTMDTFVDSSWYFLRYLSPRNGSAPYDPEKVKKWMPVDQYIGGIEHATMHLIYCRFFCHVLNDLGLLPFDEPAKRLFCQGMVCKMAHFCDRCKWVPEEQVQDGKCATCGGAVRSEVAKMSKTKLNTVNPDQIFEKYGADTIRLYIISDSPPDQDQLWSDQALLGSWRFLNRLWDAVDQYADRLKRVASYSGDGSGLSAPALALWRKTHVTIKKVTGHIEDGFRLNTAVASIMELVNAMRGSLDALTAPGDLAVLRKALESAILLCSPAVPHTTEEMWERMGHGVSLMKTSWPECDERGLVTETIEIPVQVNGKVRTKLVVGVSASEDEVKQLALADEKVKQFSGGKQPRRVVVVPGKLINIVV